MLGAAIAKALDARLDRAESERVVRMRLKCVTNDARTIEFDARPKSQAAELGPFLRVIELFGDGLHG